MDLQYKQGYLDPQNKCKKRETIVRHIFYQFSVTLEMSGFLPSKMRETKLRQKTQKSVVLWYWRKVKQRNYIPSHREFFCLFVGENLATDTLTED